MGSILLLALGSAMFPALLAGAAVILSRERPARLLLAFWTGGLITSISAGLAILSAFGEHAAALDSSGGRSLSPVNTILAGAGAILIALLIGTRQGAKLIDGWRRRRERAHPKKPDRAPWSERMLGNGSARVAFVAGAILNLPGPFYLIALGDIASAHYAPVVQGLIVLVFNLIMLLMVEVPMIGYVFDPERTDRWVGQFAAWLNRNGMRIIAVIAGGWGLSLLVKGIHDVIA